MFFKTEAKVLSICDSPNVWLMFVSIAAISFSYCIGDGMKARDDVLRHP